MAARPCRERIQRLLVIEMVSPRGTPDTAIAARRGSAFNPASVPKVEIAVEIVGWALGSYSRTVA